jgi:hypothetical protein
VDRPHRPRHRFKGVIPPDRLEPIVWSNLWQAVAVARKILRDPDAALDTARNAITALFTAAAKGYLDADEVSMRRYFLASARRLAIIERARQWREVATEAYDLERLDAWRRLNVCGRRVGPSRRSDRDDDDARGVRWDP